jgi:transcriptional regulator with XRE-family HTH domain
MQIAVVKIGDNLKRQRVRKALTQEELARKSRLTTASVARIERNETEPRMSTLRKLAKALDIDPAELVGE